jgi:hypothetical protein
MATPILQRKRDTAYLVYFLIHIVVLFRSSPTPTASTPFPVTADKLINAVVDLSPLYPSSLRPALSTKLLAYQAEVYQDRFFAVEIPFFEFFRYMEAVIHLPVSFWAIGALVGESEKLSLVLLAYALQTVITTATCMYDFSQWEGVGVEAKWHLASLYGPYLLIGELVLFSFLAFLWMIEPAGCASVAGKVVGEGGGCGVRLRLTEVSYVYGGWYVGEVEWGFEGVEGFEGGEEGELEAAFGVAEVVGINEDGWEMPCLLAQRDGSSKAARERYKGI